MKRPGRNCICGKRTEMEVVFECIYHRQVPEVQGALGVLLFSRAIRLDPKADLGQMLFMGDFLKAGSLLAFHEGTMFVICGIYSYALIMS